MSSNSERFAHRRRVTFAEIDAAGSVDLATVTRYSMEALEGWFIDRLEFDWCQLHLQQRVGTPFVRAELEFKSPVKPSESLAVFVVVEKVGRSSVLFHVVGRAEAGDRVCWEGRFTCVFLNAETLESIPVPDAYRQAIERDATLTPR